MIHCGGLWSLAPTLFPTAPLGSSSSNPWRSLHYSPLPRNACAAVSHGIARRPFLHTAVGAILPPPCSCTPFGGIFAAASRTPFRPALAGDRVYYLIRQQANQSFRQKDHVR